MMTWIRKTLGLGMVLAWSAGPVPYAEAAEQDATYPVDVCIVSGMKLGSMGDPYVHQHDGREIRFCCGGCVGKFNADAVNYLAKLDQLIIEKQKADYPLTVCIVSGEPLDAMDGPVDIVYENQLVRFCCKGCAADFRADPEPFLKKLREGKAPAAPEAGHKDHDKDGHRGHEHHKH